MAGYIGSGASVVSSGAERKKVFDITANTTSLTGLNYTVGKVHVYHNGVRLVDGTDYTATNSTSITLTVAAVSGDQVVVVSYASFQLSESYTSTESDARYVQPTHTGNVNITGTVTSDGLTVDGNARIEEIGAIAKLTLERGGTANSADSAAVDMLETNAGSEGANFGDLGTNGFRLKLDGSANDFLIQSGTANVINTRFGIDRDTGNVGIGTSSPSERFEVNVPSGNGLLINSADIATIKMKATGGSVSNWGFATTNLAASDFGIYRSNSAGGDPITAGTPKMYFNASGYVGIGTSNPIARLSVVDSSTGSGMELQPEVTSNTNRLTNYNRTASAYNNFRLDALQLEFQTSGNERMRIDSSGNVLIGTSTVNAYGATFREGSKYLYLNRDGGSALFVDRGSSNGSLIEFRKNNGAAGSIDTYSNYPGIGKNDTALLFVDGSSYIEPFSFTNGASRDNAIDLGRGGARFDDIYASNGTIQTSDFNEKQDIATLTATEMLVGKRISALFKTFRWKDSVAENGDNARTHTGVIAQDVQAAFTAEGLDAGDYALFISSTWWEHDVDVPAVEAVDEVTDEDGNVTTEAVEAVDAYTRTDNYDTEAEAPEGATSKTRMGIRYPELLSFVAAYNEQRFASIEARLTALEA